MQNTGKKEKTAGRLKREELFVPIIVVLCSLLYVVQVWGFPLVVVLWPYIVMAFLIICTAVVVVEGMAGDWLRETGKHVSGEGFSALLRKGMKPLIITGVTVIYLAVIEYLGFTLSNFLYLLVLLRALGNRRIWFIIVISLAIVLILHLVMNSFLQMPIPRLHIPFLDWDL